MMSPSVDDSDPGNISQMSHDTDRPEHDSTEGRDAAPPASAPSDGWWWFGRLIRYAGLGVVGLLIHFGPVSALVGQPVGTVWWIVGVGYFGVLVIAGIGWPGRVARIYAGVGGVAILLEMQMPGAGVAGVSTLTLVVTAWVPALLAAAGWWRQQ